MFKTGCKVFHTHNLKPVEFTYLLSYFQDGGVVITEGAPINRETLLHKFVELFLITLSTTVKSFTFVVSNKFVENPTTIQRAGIPTRRHSPGFDAGALTPNKGTLIYEQKTVRIHLTYPTLGRGLFC